MVKKRKEAGLLAGGQEPPVPASSLDNVSVILDKIGLQNDEKIKEGLNIVILRVVDKDCLAQSFYPLISNCLH